MAKLMLSSFSRRRLCGQTALHVVEEPHLQREGRYPHEGETQTQIKQTNILRDSRNTFTKIQKLILPYNKGDSCGQWSAGSHKLDKLDKHNSQAQIIQTYINTILYGN